MIQLIIGILLVFGAAYLFGYSRGYESGFGISESHNKRLFELSEKQMKMITNLKKQLSKKKGGTKR